MSFIYAYQEMPDDLSTNGATLTDWLQLPEIHRIVNNKYQFYGVYKLDGQNVDYFQRGNFIKAKWTDGTYQYFELNNPVKNLNSISITGRHIAFTANRNFIENSFTSRGTVKMIMQSLQNSLTFKQKHTYDSDVQSLHQFTAKLVKPLEAIMGSNNGNQNLVGVTGTEIDMDNWKLTLVDRLGADNGLRVDFGVNLEAIEETIDSDSIVNSLYLVGGTPENDYDEEKDPITFKYLEVAGVTNENRRIGKRENSNIIDVEQLKKWGQGLFDKDRIHEPKITHDVSMVDLSQTVEYADLYADLAKLNFGDTAHVSVPKLNIEVAERMVECVWFPTIEKYKSLVLGNDLSMYTYQTETKEQMLKNEIELKKELLVTNTKNATAWITGNKGGYVIMHPEKSPSDLMFLDNPVLEEAKQVLRLNKQGIGFSKVGWQGPFNTAWTLDGVLTLGMGMLRIGIEGTDKFMINTVKGLEFFTKDGSLGRIGTTTKSFSGMPSNGGQETAKALSLELEEGEFIQLSDGGKSGLYIPNHKITTSKGADIFLGSNEASGGVMIWTPQANILVGGKQAEGTLVIQATKGITLIGDVNVNGKLTIKGEQVYPGQGSGGGGGWNGTYPPEVTSSADKFAWELYSILLSKGYSKSAACGILGNVQGEVGPSMNPDTAQDGGNGPGYGAVQWDGSAYPLVGAPTWNGREYVQRLMDAARINDDYRTMKAQAQLIDWCMYNGQWIGKVDPTSVTEFKKVLSPEKAAYAFELNFERPAAAHPERQGWAMTWYNKFKDLKQPVIGGKYIRPMNQYSVTSEFGWRTSPLGGGTEFHNAIDLASNGGNAQIFASNGGQVVKADGANWDWYGNYVVIKHADGLYTGYAHLSQIKVQQGQMVDQGQVIGIEGATGPVTGPHLHFQFMKAFWPNGNDDFENPRKYVQF